MNKKITIGEAHVDAGMIWIGDPCYTIGEKTYEEFSKGVRETGYFGGNATHCEPFGRGVGFAIASGYGDGSYPVTIEVNDHGLVVSATISFEDDVNEEADR